MATTIKKRPNVLKKSVQRINQKSPTDIIKNAHITDYVKNQIYKNNTLAFICDLSANKKEIKNAITELYKIKVQKVNTLITPKGKKKAYVRCADKDKAVEIARLLDWVD